MSDIDTAVVDSLKVLDPKRPIREADMRELLINVCFGGIAECAGRPARSRWCKSITMKE